MEQSSQIPISTLFGSTIEAMAAVAMQRPPRERVAIERAIQTIRDTQPHAERLPHPLAAATVDITPRLASGIVEPDSHEAEALRAWGVDLMHRREAAGLSRPVLAERAGISESTLRNVEKGRRPPTRTTIMHLQSVPELRIETGPPSYAPGRDYKETGISPNCWLAPEYDALKLHQEMKMQLNGRGGHIEQTYLYLDPISAAAWCSFAEQESYTTRRMAMPLGRVAAQIYESIGGAGLDVIGLGCGDGKDEVRLTQCLLEQSNRNLRLYLLDISQPLCCAAYRHAAHMFGHQSSVSVYAIQGNFYNLQRYPQLLATPQRTHRRRIVCMFGNTFANLVNEVHFVRGSLGGFAPGDLLLLSVPEAMAPADQPEEIIRRDPRLARKIPAGVGISRHDEQLISVLNRYIAGSTSVELNAVLDRAACVVPGSYAADVQAKVQTVSDGIKHFSILSIKRYDREKLDAMMVQEGWESVSNFRYDVEYHPLLMLLYRRTRHSTDRE